MAKFVKLAGGSYIDVNKIITIAPSANGKSREMYLTGGILIDNIISEDIQNILKASEE